MNRTVITCTNLNRSYGAFPALIDFSLDVLEKEIFGIIGPDGAGKTTLFRILATLILPDSGSASFFGNDIIKDFKEIRKTIGYMPGRFSLYQDLTVEENLKFYASVFGVDMRENYHLIEDIYKPLEPFRKRRAGKLSGGMKQKLALACALIHNPTLLILDEPTTGVDAVSRKEFWDHLKQLKDAGMTLLVSTPYMDEAQRCDRLVLVQKGAILDIGTPAEIRGRFRGKLFGLRCSDRYQALNRMRQLDQVDTVHAFGQILHFTLAHDNKTDEILRILKEDGIAEVSVSEIIPEMEDCFMQKMS